MSYCHDCKYYIVRYVVPDGEFRTERVESCWLDNPIVKEDFTCPNFVVEDRVI